MEEDYATVAALDGGVANREPRQPAIASALILVLFGLLLAVAAHEARNEAPQSARELTALRNRIESRQGAITALTSQLEQLRGQVVDLQGSAALGSQRSQDLLAGLTTARTLTGASAVTGPGVRITTDNSPNIGSGPAGKVLDVDLQVLVNGLWQAGAEAVAINSNRLSPLSAIRTAGRAITVNYRSLSPPYVVLAIGDPDTLQGRFVDTPGGQAWLDLQTNFGLRFTMDPATSLTLPAAPPPRLRIQYAQRQGELP